MMFYLDMEGDSKNMSDLRHVRAALIKCAEDLQQKIGRGEQKKTANGPVKDADGNQVGEWDVKFFDDSKE